MVEENIRMWDFAALASRRVTRPRISARPSYSLIITVVLLLSITVRLHAQTDAASALRSAGFSLKDKDQTIIEIGWGKAEWTPELWQRLPELKDLTTLRGTAKCADTAALEVLTKLPKLESVYLNASTFDDAGFAVLARAPALTSISLDHNQTFTGAGVSALKSKANLRTLRFGGCMKFNVEGVKACGQLTQLESLQLHHVGVSDDDLKHLAGLVNLKSLFLSAQFNGRLSDAGLAPLPALKNLETLKLAEMVLTADGLKQLVALKALKTLTLEKIGITEQDIAKLKVTLPDVKIEWTPASADDAAMAMKRHSQRKQP